MENYYPYDMSMMSIKYQAILFASAVKNLRCILVEINPELCAMLLHCISTHLDLLL